MPIMPAKDSSPPVIINTEAIAEASIIEDSTITDSELAVPDHNTTGSSGITTRPDHGLTASYRHPSHLTAGQSRGLPLSASPGSRRDVISEREHAAARKEQRNLLRDNALIPPKLTHETSRGSSLGRTGGTVSSLQKTPSHRESTLHSSHDAGHDETARLLPAAQDESSGHDGAADLDSKWEDAVISGKIHTTWRRELKVLLEYSWPLIITFILQYSLTFVSVLSIGRLGKIELGAVSLASMTASITGYGVYHGMCTALDTLCAQAYGSGHKHLVGLQMQRMIVFLLACSIPIACVWLSSTAILDKIVYEKETAKLAGLYLKIIVLGLPGYLVFESGKRFVQAQGLFKATLCVLLFVAPFNAILHWLFIWHLQWGFLGAPIAVVITDTLLPIGLLCYVLFVEGKDCWGGFNYAAFRNWGPMIRLALPGLAMVEAEILAFEALTLATASLGSTELAAQSVLNNIAVSLWQVPFSVSIAASTRIANLIGATLIDAARVSATVAFVVECFVGLFNMILITVSRNQVPYLFTNVLEVIETTTMTLPVVAAFQLFDSLTACCNGILRGIGRQEIGGIIGVLSYYAVGLPISFVTCFGLHWGLRGLWAGPATGLGLVSIIEGIFIYRANWNRSVDDAKHRASAA